CLIRVEQQDVPQLHHAEDPLQELRMHNGTRDHYAIAMVCRRCILAEIDIYRIVRATEPDPQATVFVEPVAIIRRENVANDTVVEANRLAVSVAPDECFDAHRRSSGAEQPRSA